MRYKKGYISVIMPTYNTGSFLVESIESILGQTYKNFELIIINDASTDKTSKIIENYQRKYPEIIKIINLKKRQGAFAAANRGIRISKGEYLAPMDSDDISEPQRLEKEIKFLEENPNHILVGTQAKIIDEEGEIIGEKVFPTEHNQIYKKFFEVHPIVHPSCMIRRSLLFDKKSLYRNKFGVNDDYYTLFILLKFGKFANLPEFLFNYRIHQNNSSLQNIKDKFFNTVRIRIKALIELNYNASILDIGKLLTQVIVVSLIPSKMMLSVYYFHKGFKKKRKEVIKKSSLSFVSVKTSL